MKKKKRIPKKGAIDIVGGGPPQALVGEYSVKTGENG